MKADPASRAFLASWMISKVCATPGSCSWLALLRTSGMLSHRVLVRHYLNAIPIIVLSQCQFYPAPDLFFLTRNYALMPRCELLLHVEASLSYAPLNKSAVRTPPL
ncbi:hypothetical protein BJV74DRAFT_297964 [Russula compacta]|nr:hypothetical protein BJV74DRAFT_297964 [Russula compacta]